MLSNSTLLAQIQGRWQETVEDHYKMGTNVDFFLLLIKWEKCRKSLY